MIAALHLDSVRLRSESSALMFRTGSLLREMRALSDELVLVRTDSRKLRNEAHRLEELRRALERSFDLPEGLAQTRRFADCDVFEDPAMLIELNAVALECGKCGSNEQLVAVVRFRSPADILAICGRCFQELEELALGAVV